MIFVSTCDLCARMVPKADSLLDYLKHKQQFLPRYYIRQMLLIETQEAVDQLHQCAIKRRLGLHIHAAYQLAEFRCRVVVPLERRIHAQVIEATR